VKISEESDQTKESLVRLSRDEIEVVAAQIDMDADDLFEWAHELE
jgi:hypothetical protein